MDKKMKIKFKQCCSCKNKAIWEVPNSKYGRYFCADCYVPSFETSIKNDEGFKKEEKKQFLHYQDILDVLSETMNRLPYKIIFDIKDLIGDIYLKNRDKQHPFTIEYNKFMSDLGFSIKVRLEGHYYQSESKNVGKFYRFFKHEISKCKIK